MSASRNADSVANQQGQFGSHVARDEPQTTHGVRSAHFSHGSSHLLHSYPTHAVENQIGGSGRDTLPAKPLIARGFVLYLHRMPPSKFTTLLTVPSQHKPGVLVGNDAAPEFSAKTLPPGSAPAERTFKPNAGSEVPGQANNDLTERSHGKESTKTSASDTLGGSTSSDVHTGLGHPGQGQTSRELRHDKNVGGHGGGLAGVGASAASGNQMADERTQESQRASEKEEGVYAGTRSSKREPQPDGEI